MRLNNDRDEVRDNKKSLKFLFSFCIAPRKTLVSRPHVATVLHLHPASLRGIVR